MHGIQKRRVVDDAALVIDVNTGSRAEQADLLRHTLQNTDTRRPVPNKTRVQIRIVAVGKLKVRYAVQACADFEKRLRGYFPVDIVEVKAVDGSRPDEAIREEGRRILKHLQEDDCVWLLDRSGDELSSEQLSGMIGGVANAGTRRLALIVAGTYGASTALRERAHFVWSLSPLTFLHEWARMIVLEQLYRAAKIARNEPYHH
jgi:23S rRNA (pseudouridine1915-N3)-methyltransferase